DMSGYILAVNSEHEEVKQYFDVLLKISVKVIVTIRVSRKMNFTLEKQCFLNYKSKAVCLGKLTATDKDDIFFYNSQYGSTIVGIQKLSFKLDEYECTNIKD
uniref:Uncharacterized protein n=1 Tax=Clytia hemisphaerica TaxID=252671 RepID=A0A7M5XPP4_9CNID